MKTIYIVCLSNDMGETSNQVAFLSKTSADEYILNRKKYSEHKPWTDYYFIDEVELNDE